MSRGKWLAIWWRCSHCHNSLVTWAWNGIAQPRATNVCRGSGRSALWHPPYSRLLAGVPKHYKPKCRKKDAQIERTKQRHVQHLVSCLFQRQVFPYFELDPASQNVFPSVWAGYALRGLTFEAYHTLQQNWITISIKPLQFSIVSSGVEILCSST